MSDGLYVGDVRDGLRQFAAQGVRAQTCVTSPPYWGLRDYGVAGQIGLEPTLAEWLETVVSVFRFVREVLADDGTLWLNLGDAYNAGTSSKRVAPQTDIEVGGWRDAEVDGGARVNEATLKRKDLIGQPWRLALALQADGWYLRSDIIWAKPNPMPESVTDRPTKAHEYVFLLSKRERYYYDAEAICEPSITPGLRVGGNGKSWHDHKDDLMLGDRKAGEANGNHQAFDAGRNRRTVWSIATEPYADAHFATFPTALVEPCIAAGSRVGDIVLDPFMGSGTVAQVAQQLGRRWAGCELNPTYAAMIHRRTAQQGLALMAAD